MVRPIYEFHKVMPIRVRYRRHARNLARGKCMSGADSGDGKEWIISFGSESETYWTIGVDPE